MYRLDALDAVDSNLTILPICGPNLYTAIVSLIEQGDEPEQWQNINLDLLDYVRYGLGRGLTGNGVNEGLAMRNTINNYAQPLAMHVIRRVTDAESGQRYFATADDGTNSVSFEFNNSTPQYRGYLGGGSGVVMSGELGTCSLTVASYAQNNLRLYRNLSHVGTQAGRTSQALPAQILSLLVGTLSGVYSGWCVSTVQQFALFSAADETTVLAIAGVLNDLHSDLCTLSA